MTRSPDSSSLVTRHSSLPLTLPDRLGGERGLLPYSLRHPAHAARIPLHVFEVFGPAYEVKRAKRLPDLLLPRQEHGDLIPGGDLGPVRRDEPLELPGERRTDFPRLRLSVPNPSHDAATPHGVALL